ncbi:DUF4145 domain-containing protein [Candidatus Pacearchaeota archaeon]|nr:DUF4145 domain-containing protein [Candidatus Pacearchaeota archaeon]
MEILNIHIGNSNHNGDVVLSGICSFCNNAVTFRQIGFEKNSSKLGRAIAICCEGCQAIQIYSISQKKIYPEIELKGLEELPEELDKYYQEALRCISHNCPNGAMTLFRKLIHQLTIHYELSQKNDNRGLHEMIKKLNEKGHINEKLQKALLEVRDFGNDGAHVNNNEPTIEQAMAIKHLIDSVFSTSIFVDKTIKDLEGIKSENSGKIIVE